MMETSQPPVNPYGQTPPAPGPGAAPAPSGNPTYNPYAPPSADLSPEGLSDNGAEAIRNELLKHEASIKSIGSLYGLSFIGVLLGALTVPLMLLVGESADNMVASLVTAGLFAAMAAAMYFLARGLRNLSPGVRIWATLLSCFGLLGIPFGTLFHSYILWLLHSEKGKRVMTPEYQDIVARTPHIKYKTPMWLLLMVALIILAVIVAIILSVAQ